MKIPGPCWHITLEDLKEDEGVNAVELLGALVREVVELKKEVSDLAGTIGFMRTEIGNLEYRCADLEDRLS